MASITVLEIWTARFPASAERKYVDKHGNPAVMEARPARTATIIHAEGSDGIRNQVEIPEGYDEKISVGDVLNLTIPDWPDAPFRSRNVTRHIPAGAKK